MRVDLPVAWVIALNVAGWPVIQLGLAWAFTRLPVRWFNPAVGGPWKFEARLYEDLLGIKRWKDRLPDAARWFAGGFAKANLATKEEDYLRRFISETWRGELCHWVALGCAPVFLLWNPWWADVIMIAYALFANLPCILVQRYNRLRLRRLLALRSQRPKRAAQEC